jgi:hypothetical protein
VAVYGWLVFSGESQAIVLNRPFRILDWSKPEPASLVPELGRMINKKFPEGTTVFCNFFAHYGLQFEYYAQRTILSPDEWPKVTEGADNTPIGGVVWLGKPDAKEIRAAVPAGSREEINVRGIPFYFWKPNR